MVLRRPPLAGPDMASPLRPPPDALSSSDRQSFATDRQPCLDAQDHENGGRDNPWAEGADESQRMKRSLPTVLQVETAPRSALNVQSNGGLAELSRWREPGAATP